MLQHLDEDDDDLRLQVEEQSLASLSENIEESPFKKDRRSKQRDQTDEQHHKIYQFPFNENNAKSVISSTDRKKPSTINSFASKFKNPLMF